MTMDWLKERFKERSSKNGLALIAVGVTALAFKPILGLVAYAAIVYGAWQYWKRRESNPGRNNGYWLAHSALPTCRSSK